MLFGCQRQDSKAERSGDEHLDENALSTIDIRGKHRAEWEVSKEGRERGGKHPTRTCTQVDRE